MFYKVKNVSLKSGKGTVSCIIRTSTFETLKSTGVSVAPSDFDTATGKVKKRVEGHVALNARIQALAGLMEEALDNVKANYQAVTKAALEAEIEKLLQEKTAKETGEPVQEKKIVVAVKKKVLLTDKVADFIKADVNNYRPATIRGYEDLKSLLKAYSPKLELAQVDLTTFQGFQKFLLQKGLRNGSVRAHIQRFKTVYRVLADEAGLLAAFLDKFKMVEELYNDEVVYLTQEEVEMIAQLQVNCKAQKQIRLQFLLGCEVGLRHQDLVRLTPNHITGDTLTVVTTKKNITAKPPITKKARAILDVLELPAKKYHINYYNKVLRIILQKIEHFHTLVTLTHYVNNMPTEVTLPKWQVVSSHTARKTAINNWLAKGVRESVAAMWAGHRNTKMIVKHYSNKEAAATTEMQKLMM